MSRLAEAASAVPLGTLVVIATCVALHVSVYLFGLDLSWVMINAYYVVYKWEVYRLLSSALFHMGLMHIAFNMMSAHLMGASLERFFGTLRFLHLTLTSALLANTLYVGICEAAYWATGDLGWLTYSAVGFSGVLFTFAFVESVMSPFPTRSVFGFFSVPTKLYPWVLLVLLQVVMPNISFLGHFTGILVGVAYAAGWLRWITPGSARFKQLDEAPALACMRRRANYVPCPEHEMGDDARQSARSVFALLFGAVAAVLLALFQFLRALVFGGDPSQMLPRRAPGTEAAPRDVEAATPASQPAQGYGRGQGQGPGGASGQTLAGGDRAVSRQERDERAARLAEAAAARQAAADARGVATPGREDGEGGEDAAAKAKRAQRDKARRVAAEQRRKATPLPVPPRDLAVERRAGRPRAERNVGSMSGAAAEREEEEEEEEEDSTVTRLSASLRAAVSGHSGYAPVSTQDRDSRAMGSHDPVPE